MENSRNQNKDQDNVAAVTGASGFMGSWITRKLLDRGWTVHGTVRDPDDEDKVSHLKRMDKELNGTLRLFKADLLEDGSFKKAFDGVRVVFHSASPFKFEPDGDAEEELIKPAVRGTENVIREALKADSVRRVVLTSSVAAVFNEDKEDGATFDESDWNSTATVEDSPYQLSKYKAEKRAWELFDEQLTKSGKRMGGSSKRKSLVVINPSFVLGAPLSDRDDGTSVGTVKSMLDGSAKEDGGVPAMAFPVVDVEDVAEAHVRAAERHGAEGRYIISGTTGPYKTIDMANVLREEFPDYPVPDKAKDDDWGAVKKVDTSKAERDLGMQWTKPEDTIKKMGRAMIDRGIVERRGN